jgi:pilus assembly protein Flp/PilA
MMKLYCHLASMWKSQDGAAMVEYGVLVAGIAAVVVATVFLLGPPVRDAFKTVLDQL